MNRKKYLLLGLAIIVLAGFIFITSYVSPSDSLISFAPDDALFYLHLDLNKFHWAGYQGLKWLENFWPEEILKEWKESSGSDLALIGANFQKEIIPLLDEVGVAGLIKEDSRKINLILILKKKKWAKDLPIVLTGPEGKQFFSEKVGPHVWRLSSQPEILSLPQRAINARALWPGSSWGKGSVNLKELMGFLDSENLKISRGLDQESEEQFFEFSFSPKTEDLFFDSRTWPELAAIGANSFDFFEKAKLIIAAGDKPNFVFAAPKTESLEELESRIKINLAFQEQIEKEVVLPDKSAFIELLADPSIFNFEKKEINGTEIRCLTDAKAGIEVALAEADEYTFVSDNSNLLEDVLGNYSSLEALYWRIEKFGLKDLVITTKEGKIKGYLNFDG